MKHRFFLIAILFCLTPALTLSVSAEEPNAADPAVEQQNTVDLDGGGSTTSGDVAAGAGMTDLISASGRRYHIASNAAPICARSGDSPFSARLIYHYSRCAGKSKIRGKIKV